MTKPKEAIHPSAYLQAVKDIGLRVILVDDVVDLFGVRFAEVQKALDDLPELVKVGPRAYSLRERR